MGPVFVRNYAGLIRRGRIGRRFDVVLPKALRGAAPDLLARTAREVEKECRKRLAKSHR